MLSSVDDRLVSYRSTNFSNFSARLLIRCGLIKRHQANAAFAKETLFKILKLVDFKLKVAYCCAAQFSRIAPDFQSRKFFAGNPLREYLHYSRHLSVTTEVHREMSLQEHVDTLRAKHAMLEEQIDAEQLRPLPDQLTLAQLKKEKLRLKEEIEAMAPPDPQTRH